MFVVVMGVSLGKGDGLSMPAGGEDREREGDDEEVGQFHGKERFPGFGHVLGP